MASLSIRVMKILKMGFGKNPNIGLYVFASTKFCLVPKTIRDGDFTIIEETLGVKAYKISIAGTDLLGVFCMGNSSVLMVPKIAFDSEIKEIEKICKEHDVTLYVFDSEKTALGNLIKANDKGIVLSSQFLDEEIKVIESVFSLKSVSLDISESLTIGSGIVVNNTKGVVHSEMDDKDLESVKKALVIDAIKGTVNFGQAYVSSGLIMNDYGFIIGDLSSGVEIMEIDEFLNRGE
jgi:translation initiation factor 6